MCSERSRLRPPGPYGTIGAMNYIRPRLTAEDLDLILAALRARAAMSGPLRRHRIERLVERLGEPVRGNPKWRHTEYTQTHEDELEDEDS